MDLNQAFENLKIAGGARAARIILRHFSPDGGTALRRAAMRMKIRRAARLLKRGVPVAKIIGEKWFYGMPFCTSRHTFDPRPDSETIISAVLASAEQKKIKILDLGTGTGCLICAIVKNLPDARGVGIEKSWRARRIARKNVKNLGLGERIKIIRGDFRHPPFSARHQFDIIVSNPPYIACGDPRVDAGALHDPRPALYAGVDGLDAYRSIARAARGMLRPGGRIFLEIGLGQSNAVCKIFSDAGWMHASAYNDLSNARRVIEFMR
jgi:release factor glutamine methyltransferase